jgi:two-component system sensor histidine kinase KdpD
VSQDWTVQGWFADPGDGSLSRGRVAIGYLLASVGGVLLTVVLVPLRRSDDPSYEAMLFLGMAVATALVGGRGPALTASVVGALFLNFFFTAPLHSLSIASGWSVLTLAVYVVTSVAVSAVVDSAARRRHQAEVAGKEATTLSGLNRTVLGGEYDVDALLRLVAETFGATRADLVPRGSVEGQRPDAIVVPAGRGQVLVVEGGELGDGDWRIVHAFASHLGVLREREEAARQAAAAHELEAANRTRTALLAAVSHDLRTPLAGIRAAADTLRSGRGVLDEDDTDALLEAISDATSRLTTIVVDLLDMSRLQTGAVQAMLVPTDLGEVVARALVALPHADRVDVEDDLPSVLADEVLLERVLANLLANAVRYGEHVRVSASRARGQVLLRIADDGPGVQAGDRARMFEPFQRLGDAPRGDGVGLGLAVARGLTEAQGGSLAVSDTPGGGLTLTVTLREEGT